MPSIMPPTRQPMTPAETPSQMMSLRLIMAAAASECRPQCLTSRRAARLYAPLFTAGNVDGPSRVRARPSVCDRCGLPVQQQDPRKGNAPMTKRAESKYKINRRLGVNLWGRAEIARSTSANTAPASTASAARSRPTSAPS